MTLLGGIYTHVKMSANNSFSFEKKFHGLCIPLKPR